MEGQYSVGYCSHFIGVFNSQMREMSKNGYQSDKKYKIDKTLTDVTANLF